VVLTAAVINILFLFVSLYSFGKSFELNNASVAIFLMLSLLGWGSFSFFFAGIYDFSNLTATGSFPATMGAASIFLILALSKKYLKNGILSVAIMVTTLSSALLISHLLSGIILFSFMVLLMAENFLLERKISARAMILALSIFTALILSLFIWPLFNLITLLTSTQTVQIGGTDKVTANLFDISAWQSLLGISILGLCFLPLLYREKKYFVLFLTLSSALMTLSYLLPVRVSLYWRFFPFVFLGLSLTLAMNVLSFRKSALNLLLFAILGIGIWNSYTKIELLLKKPVANASEFSTVIAKIPPNSVVLSDPNSSYHIAAFYPINTASISYNHANPSYIKQSQLRYEDNIDFLTQKLSSTEQKALLEKYKVDFVLINTQFFPDFILLTADRNWLLEFKLLVPNEKVYEDDNFILYKISK
jgi:hypothetical protein